MKPVLLGINNPHSDDPEKALGLEPRGASGHRLWLMLKDAANRRARNLQEEDYLKGFDRQNLMDSDQYSVQGWRDRISKVKYGLKGRKVVMLGTKVPISLGLRHTGFHMQPQTCLSFQYFVVPHPSGLCREYNDPSMRERVGDLLFKLIAKEI